MNPVSRETLPLLSFIIGLGIAVLLFHKPFQVQNTLALPISEIEQRVVRVNGTCYKYSAEDSQCEILSSK